MFRAARDLHDVCAVATGRQRPEAGKVDSRLIKDAYLFDNVIPMTWPDIECSTARCTSELVNGLAPVSN